MTEDGLFLVLFAYLGLLFGVAWWAERRAASGRSVAANPYIYTLSIAVYCTAWTFYGSVGRAASNGVSFLPIYLGPTLVFALAWLVLRKIVHVAKQQHITSIADFIGSRYGKSALLGGIVTVIAVIGILPYISLQLKAAAISFHVLSGAQGTADTAAAPLWRDTALWIALMMAAFTILFGTRSIDASERHEGMVAAIAFESVVKLIAFLAVGIFVTFFLFDGPGEIFDRLAGQQDLGRLITLDGIPGGAGGWLLLLLVSMCAIFCLPRQFQVAVVENVDESHLKKAAWMFPAYLLVINLFVLPIAFGGLLIFGGGIDPDTFVLTLPLKEGAGGLALLVFLGGLSAATGMVIVETIALATMVGNELVLPVLLRLRLLESGARRELGGILLGVRRATIVVVLLLGYAYFRLIGESYTLVTIGLVSFVAAAQFAPAILAGIYWRGASRLGAMTGLLAGFIVWGYTLLLPGFARSGWIPDAFVADGLLGIEILKPYALFGLEGLDPISHATFWSLLLNAGSLVAVSLFSHQSVLERVQAATFVDPFREEAGEPAGYWSGTATVSELRALLARFLGEAQAERALSDFASASAVELDEDAEANPSLVEQVERLLSGAIGSASARVMVASTVRGEALSIDKVMSIVDETSKVMEYSRRLEEKSLALEAATRELKEANERLKELDRLKDEFVATVSHELRTPLTSIRAFSEILQQDPDLDPKQRQEFLDIIVKETERLTRLINEVLDLAKIEAGSMEWRTEQVDLREPARTAASSMSQLYSDSEIALDIALPETPVWVRGDPDRLTQVLMNLLSNAEKFCEPKRGRVELKLNHDGGQVRLEVADNGPGIAPDQIGRLFEKFQQLEGAQSGKRAGTGLGLAISQRIVSHHGGRIHVASNRGAGTTFTVELPLSKQARTAAAESVGDGPSRN